MRTIAKGEPMLIITMTGIVKRLIRCVDCAGPPPVEAEPSEDRRLRRRLTVVRPNFQSQELCDKED